MDVQLLALLFIRVHLLPTTGGTSHARRWIQTPRAGLSTGESAHFWRQRRSQKCLSAVAKPLLTLPSSRQAGVALISMGRSQASTRVELEEGQAETFNVAATEPQFMAVDHMADPQAMPDAHLIAQTITDDAASLRRISGKVGEIRRLRLAAQQTGDDWGRVLDRASRFAWKVDDQIFAAKGELKQPGPQGKRGPRGLEGKPGASGRPGPTVVSISAKT